MHKTHAGHTYPPEYHGHSEEDLCAKYFEQHIGGGLEKRVRDEEQRESGVVRAFAHVQVLEQMVKLRIPFVCFSFHHRSKTPID